MFEKIKAYFKGVFQIIKLWNQKRIKGDDIPVVDNDTEYICKNCGVSFFGRYCSNCGQSSHIEKLTWKWVILGLLGGITNASNGFGRTIVELFYRPGYMIADFIKGRRVIYSGPFQLLFVLAALYLFVSFIITSANQDVAEIEEKSRTEVSVSDSVKVGEHTDDKSKATDRSSKDQKTVLNAKEKEKIAYRDDIIVLEKIEDTLKHSLENNISNSVSLKLNAKEKEKIAYRDDIIVLEKIKDTLKHSLENNASDSVDIKKSIDKIDKKIEKLNRKIVDKDEESKDYFKDLYNKLDRYKTTHPFFTSVVKMLYDWFNTNKAVSSVLGLPFVALAISWSFRRNKNGLKYNFTEMLFVGCYMSCQNVIVSLVFLCIGLVKPDSLFIFSWILLPFWTLKELFGNSVWKTVKKMLLYYLYITLIVLFIALFMSLIIAIFVAIL